MYISRAKMNVNTNRKIHILFLLIICFISYSNILSNPFVVDDDDFIVRWNATRSLKNLPLFFKGLTPESHEGVYRPGRCVLYVIAYKLFGINPFGYHVFSILVHLSCTVLVYLIILSIMRNGIISFISAVIFAIHPVHTESITFTTSSFDMAGIVFILLSFYLYILYTAREKRLPYYISIFSALFGYFIYEVTLVFPLLLILYGICFKLRVRFKIYLPYIAGGAFYILVRLFMIGLGGKGGYVLGSFYYTMLMMPKVFLKYIAITIFPVNLTMNHQLYPGIYSMLYAGYDKNILSSFSFSDPRVLIPLITIIIVIGAGIAFFKKRPIITFSIGWFFISLVPFSNIIPVGILMAERFLYLASFGYCFLFGYLLWELYNSRKTKYIAYIVFCAFSLFYFKTTILRNLDWNNPLFLWDTETVRFPESSVANNNLGYAYMKIGKNEEAIKFFKKAKGLSPYDIKARENLVVCYIDSRKYDEAINECEEILEIAPDTYGYYKVYVNLSAAYNGKGMFDEAIINAKKAIDLNPNCLQAYNNLIIAFSNKGDCQAALTYYNKARAQGLIIDINQQLVDRLKEGQG